MQSLSNRWLKCGTKLARVLAVCLPLASAKAQSFSGIVAFGDSWSDSGNANQISNGGALPLLQAPYANGRFTNGFLWVDYLADQLAVPRAGAERVSTDWTNFAHGGARLNDGNRMEGLWEIRDIGAQVDTYLSRFTPTGSELHTFFGGGNNIASGDLDPSDEIARLTGYIGSIYDAGGREFLVANMVDFGKVADFTGNGSMTSASNLYNSLLDSAVDSLRLTYADAHFYEADFHGVLESVYANPAAYGFNPALKDTSYAGDFIWTDVFFEHRQSINNYMWIDGIHPTDNLHELFAGAAIAAVPEPSGALLLGLTASVGLLRRRRRGQTA